MCLVTTFSGPLRLDLIQQCVELADGQLGVSLIQGFLRCFDARSQGVCQPGLQTQVGYDISDIGQERTFFDGLLKSFTP